jgi:hypothetical protein
MALTRRTAGLLLGAPAAVALLATVLPAAAGTAAAGTAAVTYKTISGRAECGGTSECTATFTGNLGESARLATTTPVVVQTGAQPSVGPGEPVSLLTGATGDVGEYGAQGYRFRVLDQTGAISPVHTSSYYHASVPFADSGRAAASVLVTTDPAGNAAIRFPRPLVAAPVAVIATGSSPYIGPGLPVNLITNRYSTIGFGLRVLDQAGAPIGMRKVRVQYWATVQAATPNTRAGTGVVTPNERGLAFLPWPMLAKGFQPVSVVLTGVAPANGPTMPVNLLAVSPLSDGTYVRVLDQAGRPVTSSVTLAFYATKLAASTG